MREPITKSHSFTQARRLRLLPEAGRRWNSAIQRGRRHTGLHIARDFTGKTLRSTKKLDSLLKYRLRIEHFPTSSGTILNLVRRWLIVRKGNGMNTDLCALPKSVIRLSVVNNSHSFRCGLLRSLIFVLSNGVAKLYFHFI